MATVRETRSNPVPKFATGEKVLCYEPDPNKARVLYESKVLEVDITKDDKGKRVPEYFIHFNGWNRSWDRWVVEDQVLKDTENNRSLMSRLHEQALKTRMKKKRRFLQGSESKDSDDAGKSERKSISEVVENPELPKVEIEIPSQLKLKLEDDCYFIKRKKKLVKLPRTPNVVQVLQDYFRHYQEFYPGQSSNLVKEAMDGLRIYFDFTLPTLLLYNFEREQYQMVMKFTPHPEETKDRHQEELNGKTPTDNKYGIVSSSTESSPVKQDFANIVTNQTDTKEGEAKQERLLRRRTPRNSPANVEASQSATVSSTSSSPECNASAPKRKAVEIEDCSSQITAATFPSLPIPCSLSVSTHTMPSQIYGPEHLLRLFVKLPGLLARTDMPEKNLDVLLEQINTFLRYLAEHSHTLFPEDVYYNSLL